MTRDQLAEGYGQFFERIGREKWTGLIFVHDLHFREAVRGARADLDEAIVFVFRDISGKPMIVGHYADY